MVECNFFTYTTNILIPRQNNCYQFYTINKLFIVVIDSKIFMQVILNSYIY